MIKFIGVVVKVFNKAKLTLSLLIVGKCTYYNSTTFHKDLIQWNLYYNFYQYMSNKILKIIISYPGDLLTTKHNDTSDL